MQIVHYFAPISGYAWLGIAAFRTLAARYGCEVIHAPVDIAAVFSAAGVTPPAVQSEAKRRYRAADMMRWAARREIPLNPQPRYWPANGALAARSIVAAEDAAGALAEAVLGAVWARDLNIADEAVLVQLAGECGLDGDSLVKKAESAEIAQRTAQYTHDAIALGLFGSPTYLVGEAIFFGQDRLDFLEEEIVRLNSLAPA